MATYTRSMLFIQTTNIARMGLLRRSVASKARMVVKDLNVNHQYEIDPLCPLTMEEKGLKHRMHPGKMNLKTTDLPPKLKKAISMLMTKYPAQNLEENSQKLINYLWKRQRPAEDNELQFKAKIESERTQKKLNVDTQSLNDDELEDYEVKVKSNVMKKLRKDVYHWTPIEYNAYKSLVYLAARLSNDYSAVHRVLHEIAQRDPKFVPNTLYDFGSGIGSTMWAANTLWPSHLYEHMCVDASGDMNTIARLLLQGGEEEEDMCFPGVYFRQFSPAPSGNKYDLVVSAFSLLELKNQNERLSTLMGLWERTNSYLVLVENGTNAGYTTVLEARDFILQLGKQRVIRNRGNLEGHVFAPCPHDLECPRFVRGDGTPCNFETGFERLKSDGKEVGTKGTSKFSYVILKKGARPEAVYWPRLVRPTTKASKCAHCRTCTAEGNLEYTALTQKRHGRDLYRCARSSDWGDLLPMMPRKTEDIQQTEINDIEEVDMNSNEDGERTVDSNTIASAPM